MIIKNFLLAWFGGMVRPLLTHPIYAVTGNQTFPFVTLSINIAGSFFIGIVTGMTSKNPAFTKWKFFSVPGVCRVFTTFSAFSMETMNLLQQNRNIAALIYIAGSDCQEL